VRGGARPGAGRKGVNGYRPVCATLPRDLWDALEKARRPGETTPDTLRRLLTSCLIRNEKCEPNANEGKQPPTS
jgi:hypothetical protein